MANKKQKQEKTIKQLTKQEKEMFSVVNRAHDSKGNLINWEVVKSLCST